MGYNQMLFQPSGALDPYGNQGGEFQQKDGYNQPSANNYSQSQEQPMLDPQRMAWAQALSNIGSIWAGQPMSNSVGGAYAQAKAQNDKFRQNKAALARQGEQDELMKRYTESRINKNNYDMQPSTGLEGTGIEAQMLNIVMDQSIPEGDPRKIAARQRLEKERTVTTPEGTYTIPGYDVDAMMGMNGGGESTIPEYTPKPLTGEQAKASGFLTRMEASQLEIDTLFMENPGFSPINTDDLMGAEIPIIGNSVVSPQFQQYKQAASDWIRAKLRKESGAVINPTEMDDEYNTYFPVYGDKSKVIAQKARARRVAESAMREASGKKPSLVVDPKDMSDSELFE
jgi:hypothetical protein|tara:strand:+ start:835 stop:1857 length:1023 start_codon:yes stop_codon:yes gene_type:complete